jgi:hypothetical protein
MTQEEKRIKLAEAGGWLVTDKGHNGYKLQGSRNGWKQGFKPEEIPDYFNDLNAMHELEQQTWSKEWNLRDDFCDHLALIIDPVHGYRGLKATDALKATAAQRAEALGKTLSLWE